jgi:hypothetical protein
MNAKILSAIGEALYGVNWVTPLAKDLNINRKTIQRYISGELKINPNIAIDLANILSDREYSINKLRLFIDESFASKDARLKAIKLFMQSNGSQLSPQSKVYCRLRFNNNGFFKADIQLQEPKDKSGWQAHQFDEKYFIRDLVNITRILSEKMQDVMSVFDEDLDGEYSLEHSMFDFNY